MLLRRQGCLCVADSAQSHGLREGGHPRTLSATADGISCRVAPPALSGCRLHSPLSAESGLPCRGLSDSHRGRSLPADTPEHPRCLSYHRRYTG